MKKYYMESKRIQNSYIKRGKANCIGNTCVGITF